MTKRIEAKSWPVKLMGKAVREGDVCYGMFTWERHYTTSLAKWIRHLQGIGANVSLALVVDFKPKKKKRKS